MEWSEEEDAGASGGKTEAATPDIGTERDVGYGDDSPRLDYVINFGQPGPHFVWVRGRGPDPNGDRVITCNTPFALLGP